MFYIYFNSLLKGLSINVKYVKITWTDTIRVYSETEKLKFAIYFFNTNISFNKS